MCSASELTSSLLGVLLCVFVSVISLSSRLLLVPFLFFFFPGLTLFSLLFHGVIQSLYCRVCLPCQRKMLAPFHLGAQGCPAQSLAAQHRGLLSLPGHRNMVTDGIHIPLFNCFLAFKGRRSWWEKKQAVKIAVCLDGHPFAKLNSLIFHTVE